VVDREPAALAEDATRPGYFLTGVDLQEFGTDGKLRIGLQSISATEDPASGNVRLSDVEVDYHAPTGRLWHLTANEARVPPGGKTVEFEGEVRLAGRPGEDPVAAELLTARLLLDTVAEIAETTSPVELAFGPHRMHALGMRANLKSGSLYLESDVNGRFTP
jgi:LPS export ABC transporter protein LptC